MNFWQRSAPELALAAVLALAAGCGGSKDGLEELADARAAFELGDFRKAEELLSESLALAPNNAETLVYLARLKLERGELAAAHDFIARAAELDGQAIDVRLMSAQIAWHLKEYERAAKEYQAIADDSKLEAQFRARGWTGLGIVEMSRNNIDLARVAFLRALRSDRRCASAWYHLGMLYRDGFGYLEAALEQFEVFVRLDAISSPRVQRVQHQDIPALKENLLQIAASRPGVNSRNSNASSTALSKARAAEAKGAYKNALKLYQEAAKSDPLSYPAALGQARMSLKVDASMSGQKQAYEYYRAACSLSPSAVSTYVTTGAMASRLGYYAQAVEIYSRAVAATPTSLDALDGLVRALRKVGNRNSVAQAYLRYRESLPVPRRTKK